MMAADIMRVISSIAWLALGVTLLQPTLRAMTKRARQHDAIRAIIFAGVLEHMLFNGRWFLFRSTISAMSANELSTWTALYALSTLVSVAFFIGLRWYQDDDAG